MSPQTINLQVATDLAGTETNFQAELQRMAYSNDSWLTRWKTIDFWATRTLNADELIDWALGIRKYLDTGQYRLVIRKEDGTVINDAKRTVRA